MFDVRSLVLSAVVLDALLLASLPNRIDLPALGLLGVLLVLHRFWHQLGWLLATSAVLLGSAWLLSKGQGPVFGVLGVAMMYLWRYCLAGAFGWFLVCTVRPTELVAAMTRLRVPRWLLVPLAVVLRFVPTLATEARAIADAMRMRGLVAGPVTVLAHPIRIAEYLAIPLLAAAVRSGDELTASALSRGFGAPGRRSTIVELRLGLRDAVLVLAATAVALYGFGVFG